jgi:hypothetical protein
MYKKTHDEYDDGHTQEYRARYENANGVEITWFTFHMRMYGCETDEWRLKGYYNEKCGAKPPESGWKIRNHGGGPAPPPTISYKQPMILTLRAAEIKDDDVKISGTSMGGAEISVELGSDAREISDLRQRFSEILNGQRVTFVTPDGHQIKDLYTDLCLAKRSELAEASGEKSGVKRKYDGAKAQTSVSADVEPANDAFVDPDKDDLNSFFDADAGIAQEDWTPVDVYHCTIRECGDSILENGFRIPDKRDENKGWKLGYAVYFGLDPKYCVHEALNTMRDTGKNLSMDDLVLIKTSVKKGKHRSYADYNSLPEQLGMSQNHFDRMSEMLNKDTVAGFGYDTLSINGGTESAEVAVYDNSSIVKDSMVILPATSFAQ